MDERHYLDDHQCDLLVQTIMRKVAAKAGCEVDQLSPDLDKHHELRRALVRVAYELGRTVERHEPPNVMWTSRPLRRQLAFGFAPVGLFPDGLGPLKPRLPRKGAPFATPHWAIWLVQWAA